MAFLPILFFLFRTYGLRDDIALSQVTLLLPPASSQYKVQHLLEATGGCALWEVSNDQVAELKKPSSDTCDGEHSKSMWVVPRWTQKVRKSTHIKVSLKSRPDLWAECQIFIDQIDAIEIHTSTKVVYVGEVEDLRVLAKDSKENVFSTVSGLPFEWKDMSSNLQSLSLTQAKLNLDNHEQYSSTATDHVPICGRHVGSVPAHVRLDTSDANQSPVIAEAMLSVVVKLQVSNENLLLFPGCQTSINLFSVERQNLCQKSYNSEQRTTLIPMPSTNYKWSSGNEAIATVDKNLGTITTVGPGENCEITVKDDNFRENQISTSVRVRVPVKIFLRINRERSEDESYSQNSDADTWYMTKGHNYVVTIELYDSMGNKFDTCGNQIFSVWLDSEEPVALGPQVRELQFADLSASKVGKTNLNVEWQVDGKYTINLVQKLQITEPLKVTPPEIALPCTGHSDKWWSNFEVEGGSGTYDSIMKNPSVAEVRRQNKVMAKPSIGATELLVSDRFERENFDTVKVSVTGNIELSWLPGARDVEVNGELTLYLAIYANDRKQFANSKQFQELLQITSSPDGISIPRVNWLDRGTSPHNADFEVRFTGMTAGIKDIHARIPGSCEGEDSSAAATTKIQVYDDLTISPSEVVIAEGSCAILAWMGGPENFEGRSVDAAVQKSNPGSLHVTANAEAKNYKVQCVSPHTQELTLSVSSRMQNGRSQNSVQKTVRVTCLPALKIRSPIQLGIGERHTLELPPWLENDKEMQGLLRLHMADEDIAKLQASSRELVGKRTGRTTLRLHIDHYSIQKNNKECPDRLQAEVEVIVAFKSFTLTTPQQDLKGKNNEMVMYQDSEIFLHVEGSNSEAPDSDSFSQVQVQWRVDNSACVELRPVFGPNDGSHKKHFGVRVYGRTIGQCKIHCDITVGSAKFKSWTTIHVIDQFGCPCGNVLVPPRGEVDLHSHFGYTRQMQYTYENLQTKGNGVLVGTADAPRDEVVKVQERQALTNDVAFLTFSVRKPGGVTFSPVSYEPLCLGQTRTLEVGLYDKMGRNFTSLVGWSTEVLSEILAIRVRDRRIADARKTSVRQSEDKSLVATVTVTANSVGETLIHLGLPNVVPVFLTVRVFPSDQCDVSYLRARFSLSPDNSFYKLCTEDASKVFRYDLAKALGIDQEDLVVSEVDLNGGKIAVLIKSSGKDNALREQVSQKFSSFYYNLNLASTQPSMDWTSHIPKSPHNYCPADEIIQQSSGGTRRRATYVDASNEGTWGTIKWILKIILLIALFFTCLYAVCTWWWQRIEDFRKRRVQDMNAEQGPNSRVFEYQRPLTQPSDQNSFYNGGGIQSPNSFY